MRDQPTHTLIVVDDSGTLRCQLRCAGVDDNCRAWVECYSTDTGPCDTEALQALADDGDDEPELHGVPHRHLDIGWAVPTGDCFLENSLDWPEPAVDLQVGPGVYRVRHRYTDDPDGYFTLSLADGVVHECPPPGSGVMPCCGRTPFGVPSDDRLSVDKDRVNCGKTWTEPT